MARLKVFWGDEQLTPGGSVGVFAVTAAAMISLLLA